MGTKLPFQSSFVERFNLWNDVKIAQADEMLEAIESDNTFTHMLIVPSNGLEVRVVANKDGQKVESLNFNIQVGF